MRQYLKNLGIILLTLLLTVSVFLLSIFISFHSIFQGAGHYLKIIEKSCNNGEFIGTIAQNADKMLKYRGALGGIGEEIFEGIVSEDTVLKVMKGSVVNITDGIDIIELDSIKNILSEKIENEYKRQNGVVEISAEEQRSIDDFVDYLGKSMLSDMSLPFFDKVYPVINDIFNQTSKIVYILLPVIIVLCLAGLFFICNKNIYKTLIRLASSVTAAGLIFLALLAIVALIRNIDVFNFSTKDVYIYLSEFKKSLIMLFGLLGGIFTAAGVVSVFIIEKFRLKSEKVN